MPAPGGTCCSRLGGLRPAGRGLPPASGRGTGGASGLTLPANGALAPAGRDGHREGVKPSDRLVDLRQASGLPPVDDLREPARLARLRPVPERASGSPILVRLLSLAGEASGADSAQLSLLLEHQIATSVRCGSSEYAASVTALEDSLCTVTVLSGDVLVAADARSHPWLVDLPPVLSGAVGAYLGVPLLLADGTAIGAMCVYGPDPREWSARDVGLTCDVADIVALELQRLLPVA